MVETRRDETKDTEEWRGIALAVRDSRDNAACDIHRVNCINCINRTAVVDISVPLEMPIVDGAAAFTGTPWNALVSRRTDWLAGR